MPTPSKQRSTNRDSDTVTPQACTITLAVDGGGQHKFALVLERPEVVPGGRRLDYWNMDGRLFRTRGGGRNGRAVVECWWDQVWLARGPDEYDAIHYLLARAHLRFAHTDAAHQVYNAVHLGRCADREYALPADESARLLAELERRGPGFVQGELEQLFLRHEGVTGEDGRHDAGGLPDEAELPAYDRAAAEWLAPGLAALRAGDGRAVDAWLDGVFERARNYRRRSAEKQPLGTSGRVARFVNAFVYECAARFHVCLGCAWEALIPRLGRFVGLDTLGARFLHLMHHVDRPADADALVGRRRGVLGGYPLALHPVGRWILGQPRHLSAAVEWLEHPDYDALTASGEAWGCGAYRRFLHAILCAAAEYAGARRQDEVTGRPTRQMAGAARARSSLATPPVGRYVDGLLAASRHLCESEAEAMAAALGRVAEDRDLRCRDCACASRPEVRSFPAPRKRRRPAASIRVTYACPGCRSRQRVGVTTEQLRSALKALSARDADAA